MSLKAKFLEVGSGIGLGFNKPKIIIIKNKARQRSSETKGSGFENIQAIQTQEPSLNEKLDSPTKMSNKQQAAQNQSWWPGGNISEKAPCKEEERQATQAKNKLNTSAPLLGLSNIIFYIFFY